MEIALLCLVENIFVPFTRSNHLSALDSKTKVVTSQNGTQTRNVIKRCDRYYHDKNRKQSK